MNKSCFGKYFFFLLLISLTVSKLHAQGSLDTTKWRFSNPKQFGFTVFDLEFSGNNNAIAVGSDGGIAYTTNAGVNWTYGPFTFVNPAGLRVKPSFSDVHYATPSVVYAVGSLGCMAKSTDAGKTWSLVVTPLFAKSRNINTVWFLNKDTGYIGGQHNTLDSLPKLYFTRNGGATWDSLNAPMGGKTVVGLVNNPSLAPLTWDIDAKDKEIQRIKFLNDSVGYICGSATSTFPFFHANVNSSCAPSGSITTSAQNAALLWKFEKGVLKDYSLSKERLGYTGINTTAVTCSTRYGSITPQTQTYKAMHIVNDSMVLLMSFNNNIVVRVSTGKKDSTLNINVPGVYEKGKYEVLNFPFPPNSAPSIPATQVLLASNPYNIIKAANGKLYVGGNFGNLWTSVDTGRNWKQERAFLANQNYSGNGAWALAFTPSGRLFTAGTFGAIADSTNGAFNSNYVTIPLSASYSKMEFADCNNGIAVGGPSITVTTDGGKSWIDRVRSDFAGLNISINSLSYSAVNRFWSVTNVGTVYLSNDQGVTMNPMYSDPNLQLTDIATIGPDTIWVSAYSGFSVAAASRTSSVLRSYNGGVTWQSIGGFPVGSTAPRMDRIIFPSKTVGYMAGTRNAVYKTIDGGTTWTDISPFPALNNGPTGFSSAFVTYTEIQALDVNTVIVIGNMFTNVGIRRVYKTTDGGATWNDITSNIPTIYPVGNIVSLLFHDANNGYVGSGSTLFVTNDGGTTWNMDIAPVGTIFETMAFAPKIVPSSYTMANRRLFLCGANVSGAPMMEYGNPLNTFVNATEVINNASCTNPTGGSIAVNATGGLSPYTYSVNNGAYQSSNNFTGLAQGTYTVRIKDAFCGTQTRVVTVGFTDNLTLSTNNDTTVCAGAPVPMLATTNGTGSTYSWTPSAGLSSANIANPVATINSAATYTVTATLNGCVRTKPVVINIKPNPVVSAGPDKTILIGDGVTLNGSANGTPQSILWTPAASLTGANTLTPVASPQATTTYTMAVKDVNNCTSTDDVVVTVIPYCAKPMEAFSPNGDGINDKWLITSGTGCTTRLYVDVYNRYGSPVYRDDNYKNDWNGTYNGKPVPDGTYYYVITYTLINGKQVQLTGNLTILR